MSMGVLDIRGVWTLFFSMSSHYSHLGSHRKSELSPSALQTNHSLKEGWHSIRVPSLRLIYTHKLRHRLLLMWRRHRPNSHVQLTVDHKSVRVKEIQCSLLTQPTNSRNKSLNNCGHFRTVVSRVLPWIQPGCLISVGSLSTPAPPSHCLRSALWTFVRRSAGAKMPVPHLAPEVSDQRALYPGSSRGTSAGTPNAYSLVRGLIMWWDDTIFVCTYMHSTDTNKQTGGLNSRLWLFFFFHIIFLSTSTVSHACYIIHIILCKTT